MVGNIIAGIGKRASAGLIAGLFLAPGAVWGQTNDVARELGERFVFANSNCTACHGNAPANSSLNVSGLLQSALASHYHNFTTDLVSVSREPAEEAFGATLTPVGEALRSQLGVPAGQGLLINSLRGDGPMRLAGLKANDVLLSVADKPLATPADLSAHLKAAGESVVALKLIRVGKPITIQVKPVYRVTLGPVGEEKKEFYLGIGVDSLDDAMRAQLNLPAGRGVLINGVTKDSPAEKAGVKVHDILLEVGDKPLDKRETLSAQVQAIRDTVTTLKLLRAGKPLSVSIAAAQRKAEITTVSSAASYNLRTVYNTNALSSSTYNPTTSTLTTRYKTADAAKATPGGGAPQEASLIQQRLDKLEAEMKSLRRIEDVQKEVKALHAAVEKLTAALQAEKVPKK